MPSASVKLEKTAPIEASEPVKQCLSIIEKKMRNLEKRKIKLDNYRSDVENGKELNQDQKIAVSKYDTVLSQIEFAKELIKGVNNLYLETSRQLKKQAKKEQFERQQHEIQRLQQAFFYRHILSCFQNEDVRSDFLNGENGAVQLTGEQLSQLDQLNKLFGPSLPNDMADLDNHFHTLAENYIFLVESKNKEVAGTTYKLLKELLQSIKECGYFTRPSEVPEEDISSDDMPEDENENVENPDITAEEPEPIQNSEEQYEENHVDPAPSAVLEEVPVTEAQVTIPTAPLQEVLVPQSTFNFLQESQIDLDAPHMDPAVVAVHQIAPPTVNFTITPYPTSPPVEESPHPLTNGLEVQDPTCLANQIPVMSAGIPQSVAPVHDFDPSHPIPTQTFTNQNFAVMQNMMIPPAYVPVTMHHGPLPHVPIAVVSPSVSSSAPASVVPLHMPVTVTMPEGSVLPVVNGLPQVEDVVEVEEQCSGEVLADADPCRNDLPAEKSHEGNGYHQYRGGYRGRGRGRGNNNYYRGRSNYHNGSRGGFQNRYYQDRNGYNQDRNGYNQDRNGYNQDRNGYNNYRRDNNRGTYSGSRGNGNSRGGRGNYNRPPNAHQQQQQPAHDQQ